MTITLRNTKVVNRFDNNKVASNLTYPLGKNYKKICKLDKLDVLKKVRENFNVDDIANKYAVNIDDKLYYKHDTDDYFLIEETECK